MGDAERRFDDRAAEKLLRAYRVPAMAQVRQAVIDALSPPARGHILDVGTGPGLLAVDLAAQLQTGGAVTALDESPAMCAVARAQVAGARMQDRVTVVEADAARLPLEAGSVDGAVMVQVLEHVRDVAGVLEETARVLRPGGRIVIVDTDWRSCVWASEDEARMQRILGVWRRHFQHPSLPARLPGLLERAGFTVTGIAPVPVLEVGYSGDSFHQGMIGAIAEAAQRGGIAAADVEAWKHELRRRDSGRFFSLTRYLFAAERA